MHLCGATTMHLGSAEHAGAYSWDYLEEGPEDWRVRIGRPA